MGLATTQAPQALACYWGEGGEYGPFDIEQEGDWAGWPNAGQVLRYFRKKANLSARAFGKLYGETVNANRNAIGERRILSMELENKVPVDIGRRKTIAQLLNIPPMLFGLAVLEEVDLLVHPQASHTIGSGQTIIKKNTTDIDKCKADLRTRWKLQAISDAGDAMPAIVADTQQLELLATQAKGNFLYQVQELLFSNYYLASEITGRKRQYDDAYSYANNAVRVTKMMEDDPELAATALYQRGFRRLCKGLYGTCNKNGLFVRNHTLLEEALQDFQNAKHDAHPQLSGLLTLNLGRTEAHLGVKHASLAKIDQAARSIGKSDINDAYTRKLITGAFSGFHEGRYLTESAIIFNAAGLAVDALLAIEDLKKLNKNTYNKNEQANLVWIDIIEAESYLQLEDFDQATKLAMQALQICLDVRFFSNIAIIRDLYGRLLTTPYRKSTQMVDLGEMLKNGGDLSNF